MPIDVEQRNSPGWWMKRLFFQLNDPCRRRRLWKLHNYYAGRPPLPEGAETARETFEAFQRAQPLQLHRAGVSWRASACGRRCLEVAVSVP